MTTTEAAQVLGVSPRTLAGWAATGKVQPTVKTAGGHYRWDLADLREQLRRLQD